MKRQIVWSHRAEISYSHIIDYLSDEFGAKRAMRYMNEVHSEVSKLSTQPNLGQLEPLLEGSKILFQRLVIGDYTKVIYHVTDERIDIADVWDTRMNPEELIARFE